MTYSRDFCPYKGLQPYTESDRAFFFGRERDEQIIASNLYAAPLTVLYGMSGVGKSSVLLAGVVPLLRQTPNLAVVVFRQWQDATFVSALKGKVLRAVSESTGKEISVDVNLPLDEFLISCNRILRGPIFFIFDQFEEFFLYHAPQGGEDAFDAEWARAVNRNDVDANFLISLREEGLSRLDRFRGRIPKLLGNMLRLKHLDREAGRAAITKPLEKYNLMLGPDEPQMGLEEELTDALLDEVKTGRVTLGAAAGRGQVGGSERESELDGARIETPFLQMVLTRLWDEEQEEGSRTLRLKTLRQLGGAERIIRTHLDKVMDKLSDDERDVAARLFRFLVTPSGTKIAHTTSDLVSYAELPTEQVEPVLELLSAPDVRILRPIAAPPGEPDGLRYEIFHDVLAQAVLDWRARYAQEKKSLEEERRLAIERAEAERKLAEAQQRARRLRLQVIVFAFIFIVTAALLAFVYKQSQEIEQARVNSNSRELAAYALDNADYDPDLSLLLAIEAAHISLSPHAIDALKKALAADWTQAVLRGHEGIVRCAVFSPDGKYVATASQDKTARVWEAEHGKPVNVISGHEGEVTSVAFSPDGQYLLTAGTDKKLRVWEAWQTSSPRLVTTLEETEELWSATFSPDGRYILMGGNDFMSIWDWRNEARPAIRDAMNGDATSVVSVAFSSDGKYVAAIGPKPALLIWEWENDLRKRHGATNQVELPIATSTRSKISFSHDGKYVSAVCNQNILCIWNWADDVERKNPLRLSWSTIGIRGAAFSPNGLLVATGQNNGIVLLWSWQAATVQERATPQELLGHVGGNAQVQSVTFSKDGRFLVSASVDKTARVWRTQGLDAEQLNRMPPEELLRLAESRKVRDFTPQERERYLDESRDH